MAKDSFSQVLMTSVPSGEERFADEHLPGARRRQAPLSGKLADENADVRVLALMIHDPVEVSVLERFEALEAIVTRSDGYDHLPLAWMEANGTPGYHLGGYATTSMAHHAVMLALTLLRRVPEGVSRAQGDPPAWDRSGLLGRHLHDVDVGILGVGRIGSQVARLVTALGGRALGYDIQPDPNVETLQGFRFVGSLQALLAESDVLTVHVPLDASTRGMIGEAELSLLPEEACLVNTARGGIVDQAAVEQALREDRLAGYAADVMPGEPDPPDLDRFQNLDRALLTPHLAAYDERTTRARYERTAAIASAVLEGGKETVDPYRVV